MTNHEVQNGGLERLLDLVNEIVEVGLASIEPDTAAGRRRRLARRNELIRTLERQLASIGGKSLPRWLRDARDKSGLNTFELMLVLALIYRRIAFTDGPVTGRDLLRAFLDTPSELLANASYLHAKAPLQRLGWVESRSTARESALEATFRLGERAWRRIYAEYHGQVKAPRRKRAVRGYENAGEHLADLKLLLSLHQKRAATLFSMSHWAEFHPDVPDRPEDLSDAITESREVITLRELATDPKVRLPVVELRREMDVADDEEIILLALLFHELLSAAPTLEAAELIRLVSSSESEVVRRRQLLTSPGRLLSGGLVGLDAEIDDKPMLASAYLREWVAERLILGADQLTAIDRKEQARFHSYLERLESSEDFYRNL